jgi:hypothetical protein
MRPACREEVNMRSADRTFRKAFALAAAVALLAASRPAESRPLGAPPQSVPFTISSLGSAFGVQLKVEGTYKVYETYVEVNVERALIYVSEDCPYQGRRYVNKLSVGLATTTPRGRWDVENRGLPVFVERLMKPRDECRLAGLYFQIPRSEGTDLSQRWLVVEAEETSVDLPDDTKEALTGYHFAHSRRNIFAGAVVEP